MVNLYSGAEITVVLAKIISGLLLTNFVSFNFFPLEGGRLCVFFFFNRIFILALFI